MPLAVSYCQLPGEPRQVEALLLNPKAVAPPKGAKPWGGANAPRGYYNCNLNRYNHYFALGGTRWSKLIDTCVVNEARLPPHAVLAEILWELTFFGWKEAENEKKWKELTKTTPGIRGAGCRWSTRPNP